MIKTSLGQAVLLAALLPAYAQAQQINILMFEDASCGAWLKSADNRLMRAQYEFWIRGFVSGHNYASPSRQVAVGKLPGGEALYGYLDQYCHDNPNSSFIGGAMRLVEQFREPAAPGRKEPAKAARDSK